MKTRRQRWTWLVLLASFAFFLQTSIRARAQNDPGPMPDAGAPQDQDAQDADDQDPPGRVARLSFSQGSVSFQPAGEGDWLTAVPNRPLVTGDNLWADEDSRAEVHIGSTAIRLSGKTGITFLNLDDHTTQIRLAQGSILLRVRHVDDDDYYEVDTPNIAFTLLQPGTYRIDVSDDGSQTVVTVWRGRGRVTGGGFSYTVLGNQSATFTGSDHLDYELGQLPNQDDFDAWAFERDNHDDDADASNYVSTEMTGYEDLDDSGDWSYVAGYGECWRPRVVVAGWAPYRFGHWIWVGRWGWTWVEDEPWGFAPFHYGRWTFVSNVWYWTPGPVVIRPVWSPALVAFVGGNGGFRFSAGVGVGWFPLAPGEVFVPGYRVSREYVNAINITNTRVTVTQVTNVYNTVVINKTVTNSPYINQGVRGGVTVVSHDAFVNARPVAQNILRVDDREIASAPTSHIAQMEPIRQSVVGVGRPVTVRPPAAVISRTVVAQRTPPPVPQSFVQRQATAGGHLAQQPLVRPEPAPRPYQPAPGSNVQPQNGFRPFTPNSNAPSQANNQVRQTQPAPRTYEAQGNPQSDNQYYPAPRTMQQQQKLYQQRAYEQRTDQQNQQERQNSQPSHPLVRPAPPVQERSPQQEQQQQQKFQQWQQQRPAPQPHQETSRPAPAAHSSSPPPAAPKK